MSCKKMVNRIWVITPFRKQVWAISGALLTNMGHGISMSFPSSLLPGLRDPHSDIQADLNTSSWIVSSLGVAFIPAFFLSSFLMNYWGRRITHGLALIPGILGWCIIYFASNVHTLVIGRILNGITNGGTTFLCAIIVAEYSGPECRGVFLNLKTVLFSVGCIIVHALAFYVSWRTIALIALVPNIVALLITWTWPESPSWLAMQGQFERCESSFFWLRERDNSSIKELKELIEAQKVQQSTEATSSSLNNKVVNLLRKFKRKDFLKPLLIILCAMTLMEFSGRSIFPAYATDIFDEITGDKSMSFYGIIILDIVIIASTSFSSVLVKLIKRRTLLFSTALAALAMSVIFCTYLFLVSKKIIPNYSWIPISILIVYFIFASFGCITIPLGLLGEIIPLAHRGAGAAVGGLLVLSITYVLLIAAPYLLVSIKVHGMFAVFGVGLAVCLLILYFVLPETKDRTLQEIENFFTYGKYYVEHQTDSTDK